MYAPTYLSNEDRSRLVEINQTLLTGITSEERADLQKEQQDIMGRRKNLGECTLDELQSLRQQLFDQYQKHASIGSSQAPLIHRFIQQVEILEYEHMLRDEPVPEKKPADDKPKRPGRVSTKSSSYSWTVPIEDGD